MMNKEHLKSNILNKTLLRNVHFLNEKIAQTISPPYSEISIFIFYLQHGFRCCFVFAVIENLENVFTCIKNVNILPLFKTPVHNAV